MAPHRNKPTQQKETSLNYQSLFESIPGLFLLLSPQFTITNASNSYLAATMTRREDIINREVFEVFPDNPNDPEATGVRNLRASLERVVRKHRADAMAIQKYDIRKPDGSFEVRYWSVVNSPVLDASGKLTQIINKVEDVTDFMLLKEHGILQGQQNAELLSKTASLQKEIAERAQQLQIANERLRELDRLKTQFFANVSHELRTPLTLILGPVAKMQMQLATKEKSEWTGSLKHDLEIVERNARTLLRHVNDLLDAAKLESGHLALNYSEFDLSELTRNVVTQFELLIQEKGFQFEVQLPQSVPVQADSARIQRIVQNLVSNAVKFTPAGREIRCEVLSDATHAILKIDDGGPGIPAHLRKSVFERFFQVEETATRRFGGTGLGLAIVQDFVQLHQGSIFVTESRYGGSSFEVRIPLKAPAGTKVRPLTLSEIDAQLPIQYENVHSSHSSTETKGSPTEKPKDAPRILVVEDNAEMAEYLEEVLNADFHIDKANNGVVGLAMARGLKPDLIISDLMMPEMDGEQLIDAVMKDSELRDIPVIVLTARTEDDVRVRLLRKGASDYLIKPFYPEELLVRVAHNVASKRTRDYLTRVANLNLTLGDATSRPRGSSHSISLLKLIQTMTRETDSSR